MRDDRSHATAACIFVSIAVVCIIAFARHAHSQDHSEGHAKFHDFYREWLRPDTGTSCCNMRMSLPDGGMTGDCRPTKFRLAKGGHWEALLDDGKTWLPVPDDRVIREKNPDPSGMDGHLCESGGMVYCAVPPTGAF